MNTLKNVIESHNISLEKFEVTVIVCVGACVCVWFGDLCKNLVGLQAPNALPLSSSAKMNKCFIEEQ